MRSLLGWLAVAMLALGAGCSLIVDPASEDGLMCGSGGFCPAGFYCDEVKDECVRGSAPEDADADEGESTDVEPEAERERDADAS